MNKISNNKNLNTKSKKIDYSKSNYKNKDNIKLDSNGEEIVYEVRHNATWWDFLVFGAIFLFGIAIVCGTIIQQAFLDDWLLLLLFGGIPIILSTHHIFYIRKNKIYITHQGIGFEHRKWFRMQKGFFKFGEVGIVMADTIALSPITPLTFITIFPIGNIKKKCFFHWQLKPYCIIRLMAWNAYLSPKLYNTITQQDYLHEFLLKKTKEALESQGVDVNSLPYDLQKQFDI